MSQYIAMCNKIYRYSSSVILYCIAVMNIAIYRYIVILLHPYKMERFSFKRGHDVRALKLKRRLAYSVMVGISA